MKEATYARFEITPTGHFMIRTYAEDGGLVSGPAEMRKHDKRQYAADWASFISDPTVAEKVAKHEAGTSGPT